MRGADRDRSWAGWLGAALSLACGRTGLELDDLEASNASSGRGGSTARGGTSNLGGTGAGGAGGRSGGTGATGGTSGATNGGSAGSDARCATGEPTWSCAPAVVTGECCDANGPREPQCRDVCVPDGEPQGLPCERPGQTSEQPVVTGVSRHCEGILFACYVQECTCGCRDGAIATVPGLRETCAPTMFLNALHFPQEIVLDDEFVYWTVGGACPASAFATGKVMGARRTDGSAAFAILEQPCPRSLAEDGDDLFWIAGDSIRSAKKGGGRVNVVFGGQYDLLEVRADDDHVYWLGNRTISRQRRDESAPFEIFTNVEYRENASGIVDFELDDRYVYWLERGYFESHLYRADKADSSRGPESLASMGRPVELAISAEGLFWASELSYPKVGIFALGWGNAGPTLLIERPGDVVDALAAFADEAFWVEGEYDVPGFVYGIRAGEGEPHLTIGDQNEPLAVAADEQYVFWMNQNYPEIVGHDGEIMRVCRP